MLVTRIKKSINIEQKLKERRKHQHINREGKQGKVGVVQILSSLLLTNFV